MSNLISIIVSLIVILFGLFKSVVAYPLVIFMDVGQGDSMIYVNGNFQMIVDGGPDDLVVQNIHRYVPFYDMKIELLVVTHAHLDHYFGIATILNSFKVKAIMLAQPPCFDDYVYSKFLEIVNLNGIEVVSMDKYSDSYANITFSNINDGCVSRSGVNNSSIVTHIEVKNPTGDITVLNMGDLEMGREYAVKYKDVDVLKAGHHCSKTSSSSSFLKQTNPRLAVCSFGENSYGLPDYEVISRFNDLGVKYVSTKDQGDIVVNLKSGLIYNQAGKLIDRL